MRGLGGGALVVCSLLTKDKCNNVCLIYVQYILVPVHFVNESAISLHCVLHAQKTEVETTFCDGFHIPT